MRKNCKNYKYKVFFVGIGGISMSALAQLVSSNNVMVAGSDKQKSAITKKLNKLNIPVFYGHNESNIKLFKPDLVVYSGAINENNPEIQYAKTKNIKILERSKFLGELCLNYKNVIAVAGTHGKTTTTAMITEIFEMANLKPTAHIGGEVVNLQGNVLIGDKNYFITEACEYRKSFEQIKSTLSVVTNIECDHMDCYLDFDDLKNSFANFVNNSSACVVSENCAIFNKITKKNILTFGFNNANYVAKNIKHINGQICFDVFENENYLANFKLNLMGDYNVKNALIAVAVARFYNIEVSKIYSALINFKGVVRRNELLGFKNHCVFYADYGHHPTEIQNSIKTFCSMFKKVLCVFQPHTYTRTKTLLNEFKSSFLGVKKLIVFKTYPAREPYLKEGSETKLFKEVKNRNKQLIMQEKELLECLIKDCNSYDCILVLGAGDVYDIVKNGIDFKN